VAYACNEISDDLSIVLAEATATVATAVIVIEEFINLGVTVLHRFVLRESFVKLSSFLVEGCKLMINRVGMLCKLIFALNKHIRHSRVGIRFTMRCNVAVTLITEND